MAANWELDAAATLIYDGTHIFPFDLACLENNEEINNAVIDFYMKYLYRNCLSNEQRQKVQCFSSIFLDEIEQKVRDGTTELDLMNKDYHMMPARLFEHWFLIVICYARNAIINDYKPDEKPQILVFDSAIKYVQAKRPAFIRAVRKLIQNEFARVLNEKSDEIGCLKKQIPSVMVPVRQQDNDVDCGLFVMGNAARFLDDAFDLSGGNQNSMMIESMIHESADEKRAKIKDLISTLADEKKRHCFE